MQYKIYKKGNYPIWPSNDHSCRGRNALKVAKIQDTENKQ